VGRALLTFALFCVSAVGLSAQEQEQPDPPTTAVLAGAVANAAAIFARTAPGLVAQEVLHQHGRRGFIRILEQNQGKPDQKNPKKENVTIKLPQEFHTHDVVSDYALGEIGESHVIHEIRSILTIDGRVISPADEARHALAIGIQSPDDELKHRLLENFERNRLEGAVTDFGQVILLFAAAAQSHYHFSLWQERGHHRLLNGEPMIAIEYKQISGAAGLTVFHERAMDVRTTEGEIWLRDSDLLPLRITMFTEAPLGGNLTIRDEAVIDYAATPFGLAPLHIDHMQFLGADLLVENDLQYSGYQRLTPGIVP